jgi:hypothetical protein
MGKTLLYRLFKLGRLPQKARAYLEAENIKILDEGIGVSITYKKYRAPGKRFNWKRRWFSGSIALTSNRIVGFTYSNPVVNIAFNDPQIDKIHFGLEDSETLLVSFEASHFHQDQAGKLEFRFSTPHAPTIMSSLKQRGLAIP